MNAVADRLEFAPPPTRGLVRAVILALLAHALLMAALTWGVRWKRNDTIVTAQAELWSALPQQAAPKLVETPPAPTPVAPAVVAPPPVTPKLADADIALERDRQLRLKKEKQLAVEKLEQDKRRQQAQKEAEKLARMKAEEKVEKQKLALEKQHEEAVKLAQDKKKSEQDAKRKEASKAQEEAGKQAAQAAQRAENLKRAAALAGSSGAPSATGTALQTSGPSSSYAGRVSGKVKPNIVFTEDLPGNPAAEVEVRAAPDGTIVSRKLTKSSGSKSWDEAVLKAIDKSEVLPRDIDGRVPSPLVISFRPKD